MVIPDKFTVAEIITRQHHNLGNSKFVGDNVLILNEMIPTFEMTKINDIFVTNF